MRYAPTLGVGLFLLMSGLYVLTMSGHTYSSDEEAVLAAAESLSTSGSFAIPSHLNSRYGIDGRTYSPLGPMQSVLAVPFVMVGQEVACNSPQLTGFVERIFALLLPAVITAATVVVLYGWVGVIGYSQRVGLLLGLLYGITSLAWPHGRTFFAEPLSTFFLVLAAHGLRRDERSWWALSGAAIACALATKVQSGLSLPMIVGYGLLVCWREDARGFVHAVAGRGAFALLGMILPLGLLFFYNTLIFGGVLNTGYGRLGAGRIDNLLTGSWQVGLYGLTIGTGKGILYYSPTILLGMIGLGLRLRQQWRESLLAVGMAATHLAAYSCFPYWHGDGSWGPRYLLTMLPFVYLPAAGLIATVELRRGRLVPTLLGGLAAVSIAIQILPVLVNFDTYINLSEDRLRHVEPGASPILWHPRIWADRASEWWSRLVPPRGTAVLRDGFYYSEGDRRKGKLLPRWTGGKGRIQIHPRTDEPIEGRIVVVDLRPSPLPRATFELLLDGKPLGAVQRTDVAGKQLRWELRFSLSPEVARPGAELTIHSDTFNPSKVTADNPRNEDLGLMVHTVDLRQGGQALLLREALPIPAAPSSRHLLWLWYHDPPVHHLFDSWLWYIFVAGLPRKTIAMILALVGLPALLCFVVGMRTILAALRRQEAKG